MKENIEEDLITLEQYLNAIDTFGTIDYKCINNLYGPVKSILSDYKRLQEEFRQVDHECERLEQKEVRLEKENEELKRLIAHRNGYTQRLEKDLFENCSNYVISKQKIKDKIEELNSITLIKLTKEVDEEHHSLEYMSGYRTGKEKALQDLLRK